MKVLLTIALLSVTAMGCGIRYTITGEVYREGRPLMFAFVTLADKDGVSRISLTNAFGRFAMDEVEPCTVHTLKVAYRGIRFAENPRQIVSNGDNRHEIFWAVELEEK